MQWLEAIRIGIAVLTLIKQLQAEDGDKEGAVLGLFGLIAPKAGLKTEEVEVLIPEIKSLVGLLRDLRGND